MPDVEDVAHELRTRREAMGLSVQDLFGRTRINPKFIDALEAGEFHVLPEAYVRMFLRKVAQEVGSDPDEIIVAYDRASLRQAREEAQSKLPSSNRDSGPGWVVAAAGALILAGIAGLILLNQEPANSVDTPEATVSSGTTRQVESRATPSVSASDSRAPIVPSTSSTPAVRGNADAGGESALPSPTPRSASPVPPLANTAEAAVGDDDITPEQLPVIESAAAVGEMDDQTPAERERVVAAYSLTPEIYGLSEATKIVLSAVGLGTSSISIRADEETQFTGVIPSGRRLSWEARDRFLVEVDRSRDVQFDLQGKTLPPTEGALAGENRKVRLFISRASIWVEEIAPTSP